MRKLSFFCLGLYLTLLLPVGAYTKEKKKPDSEIKLVLQITVDGLRGDLLNRYGDHFEKGGFRYLTDNGVVYTNAKYQHANTETIVGHTTLATGTYPSVHGMIGNVWFDREKGELSYNIEDAEHTLLPKRTEPTNEKEVDPAQKLARTEGRSPEVILVPTISDTISVFYGNKPKIFGISSKDRSAVSMAGKTGKAFWFSSDDGDFVSSTYYYDELPEWASKWNAQQKAVGYAGTTWELLGEPGTYLMGQRDDRPYESDLYGFGRVFPHKFDDKANKILYTQILASPMGDKLLLDFAKELIKSEELGKGPVPDYLSISFSGVDAVNHFFGPSSLENEDAVRQLDLTLEELFKFIDKEIGLDHTLIVLSADHGMAEMPEYMTEISYEARRIDPNSIVALGNDIGKKYGIDEVVRFFYRPYLYLNYEKIESAGQDPKAVEQAIADAITDSEGIALAVPGSSLSEEQNAPLIDQIRRNHHITRSGDIYVLQKPYWFLLDEGKIAAMHGTPWSYDTHVPIIFIGPDTKPGRVDRPVHPVDVAPTIATYLGMSPPAASQGKALKEALR